MCLHVSTKGRLAVAILVAGAHLSLAACGTQPADSATASPATVEQIAGSDVKKVTLVEKAAQRLGIKTAQVSQTTVAGRAYKVIPYAALLYDAKGANWVFGSSEPLVFMRLRVSVDRVEGDRVLLSDGPAVGTTIVTVGVAELYGLEVGVGK